MLSQKIPVCTGKARQNIPSACHSSSAELSKPARILLVEDEYHLRSMLKGFLCKRGYHVVEAEDGINAWDILKVFSFDLLITDHQMENLCGLDLIKKMHSNQRVIPTIFISGSMPFLELNKCPWLRVDAMLLKPFKSLDLLNTVKDVLQTNLLPST